MKSRYSAFALGLGPYLFETLSAAHADREHGTALGRVNERQRFLGLCVLHASTTEVLFYARVFARGVDVSFAELSTFVREGGALRYASGILVPRARLGADPTTLTRESFLAQ